MKYGWYIAIAILAAGLYSCGNSTGMPPVHLLSTNASPLEGGTVLPDSGEFNSGDQVTLEARAADGYRFERWGGDLEGNSNPDSLVMNDDKHVTAIFTLREYTLDLSVEGEGTIHEEVIEDEEELSKTDYGHGTTIRLTAEPSANWRFVGWAGDLEGSENPATIVVDSERQVTARFAPVAHDLEVTVEGEGEVVEELIEDPAKTEYTTGSTVRLTAEPAEQWRFVRWEGDLEGSENPATLVIDEPRQVTAVFALREYALALSTEGEGQIREEIVEEAGEEGPSKTEYGVGTAVRLTAEPEEGWRFDHWRGDLEGSENPATLVIDEEKEVTAVFEELRYQLSTGTRPGIGGSVDRSPDRESYRHGEEVTLEADATFGYRFVRWEGDGIEGEQAESDRITIRMDGDRSVTAHFELRFFSIFSVATPEEGGVLHVTPQQEQYAFSEEVIFRAEPQRGWEFAGWEGDIQGSDDAEVNVMVEQDLNVQATFELAEYQLLTTVQPENGGMITKSPDRETYHLNDEVALTAEPATGHDFVRWEGDGTGSGSATGGQLSLTIGGDSSVSAIFRLQQFNLSVEVKGLGGFVLDGEYYSSSTTVVREYDTMVELMPEPVSGWEFLHWEENEMIRTGQREMFAIRQDRRLSVVYGLVNE